MATERFYPGTLENQKTIIAKVDTLIEQKAEQFPENVCTVNVSINATDGFELPDSETEIGKLLEGAYVSVEVAGFTQPLKSNVSTLKGYTRKLLVPCSTTQKKAKVRLYLGHGDTLAYVADSVSFMAIAGETYNVELKTVKITGETVEVVRIQPYNSTASGSGGSYLGLRVTNENGTKLYTGENSHISVSVWNVPKDENGLALEPQERIISSGGDNATDLMNYLNVFKNIRKATVKFTGDSGASVDSIFMRYEQVWTKTTLETIDGVLSVCKWLCDKQADSDYHLHPLFIRYERQSDGTVKEISTKYGYIARYPFNNYTLKIGGANTTIAVSRPDGSYEVGNTRAQFLATCRNNNLATVTVSVEGEPDIVIDKNSDPRCMSMIDLREICFLQLMSYMFFGVDVQAAMFGVSYGSAPSENSANGTTDYIMNMGIMNGGEDTASNVKNINFLGIEGGCWSAPGIMYPNFTSIVERITTTDENGTVSSSTRNRFIVATDRLDYNPGSNNEEALLSAGYREVDFNIRGNNRMGLDNSQLMRDAFLPTANAAVANINIANCDAHWQGGAPSAIAAYSSSTTYSVDALVTYNSKLYKCITAVDVAENFDETKWQLMTNESIVSKAFYMVALGTGRHSGHSLGSFSLNASYAVAHSYGAYWRSRPSLQEVLNPER